MWTHDAPFGGAAEAVKIAFDVNETLLDLAPLDPLFEETFGDASLRQQWFGQMLQIAFAGGLTDRYVDFSTAQRAALQMVGRARGVDVGEGAERILDAMRTLPAHPEVPAALDRLKAEGFTLATLTNSPLDVAEDQVRNAGIADRLDAVLSADQVQALKPRREPYALVASTFDVAQADVRLVAAHAWDVTGALAAGCAAAFVLRPGKVPSPLGEPPDIVADDLAAVAEAIVARDRP
jgi:2-haloacid dehalogenase